MPEPGANVQSLQALVDLERGLSQFISRATEALPRIKRQYRAAMGRLDHRVEELRTEADELEAALDDAREEDQDSLLDRFEIARRRYQRAVALRSRVEEEYRRFAQAALRCDRSIGGVLRKARGELQEGIEFLRQYHAVELPQLGVVSKGIAPPAIAHASQEAREASAGAREIWNTRLPDGFVWVPLAQIVETELDGVRSQSDYKKLTYQEMRQGMLRLQSEILPRLSGSSDLPTSEEFRLQDQAHQVEYEHGLQRVYEAFFGRHDYVYLVRRRGGERFEIVNGAHRIKLAGDLGWAAIPARVKDLNADQP